MQSWSHLADAMTAGRTVSADSGEALGLSPARLTITFGFGPSLFDSRYGLARLQPARLTPLPAMHGDALTDSRSGGDLYVQACSDDRQVAFHALRTLTRAASGVAHPRWQQSGFRADSGAQTPRNLLGFKDGTDNAVKPDRDVWAASPGWLRGGSYLVMRRIRLDLAAWDRLARSRQQLAIGREKVTGAPLGLKREHDPLGLSRLDSQGRRAIPLGAHVRHASPSENGGVRMLRRGYNYDDGLDVLTGKPDAGLFFLAFARDPRAQVLRVLEQLATYDRLNEFSTPLASGVYAIPPGTRRGGFVGAGLLG
jgi:deferrochelatase/peroxidase EfeB